jgi:hypothetical protein
MDPRANSNATIRYGRQGGVMLNEIREIISTVLFWGAILGILIFMGQCSGII